MKVTNAENGEADAPRYCPQCALPLTDFQAICPLCGAATGALVEANPLVRAPQYFPALTEKEAQRERFFNRFWVVLLFAAAIFAVVYRLVESAGLMQTSAMFIGIPLLIGVFTTYSSQPRTRVGATLKVTTILLCVVSALLGEGMICILMAAPMFYAMALLGCAMVTMAERVMSKRRGGPLMLVILPFAFGKATSTPDGLFNPRAMTVRSEIFIKASPDKVWNTLLHGELVSKKFPTFLKLGFPLPTKLERGIGGMTRLTFDPGSESWPGTNVIASCESRDAAHRRLKFIIQKDGTKLARWLTFRATRFEIEPASGGCRLRQVTDFEQRLQPGFYWNPLQCYAMTQMHRYALEHIKSLAQNETLRRTVVLREKHA